MSELDSIRILATLNAHGVDFVVIGGIAAVLHGSPRMTQDLDICFAPDHANLMALGRALQDLDAQLYGVEADVPFVADADTLRRVEVLTLDTAAGKLDVLARPAGSPAYDRLRARADRFDVGVTAVSAASIDDLIAMKAAAGRAKDIADIEELETIVRLRAQAS